MRFEDLGLIKRNVNAWNDKDKLFYRLKNGELYPYLKEDIRKVLVNPYDFEKIKAILKDMDFPFFIDQWLFIVNCNLENFGEYGNVFGKYVSKMKLCSFKCMDYKKSKESRFVCSCDDNFDYLKPYLPKEDKKEKIGGNMNPFAQRIGIYYVDLDWATYMTKTIVEDSGDAIERSACGKNDMFIQFKDGTYIRFCPISESVRGQRFTKAYIQDKCLDLNKAKDFIFQRIYPCLTISQDPKCYIIHEYEDLRKQCTDVRDYYWQLEFGTDWHFEKAKAMLDSAYKCKEFYHDNH